MADLQHLLNHPNLKYPAVSDNRFTSFQSKDLRLEQPSSPTTLDVSFSRFEAFSLSDATFLQLEVLNLYNCVLQLCPGDRSLLENLTQLYFSPAMVSFQQG